MKQEGLSKNIIEHSIKVSKKALQIGKKVKRKVPGLDLDLIEIGGLLHDLGRSKRHDWEHGIEGGRIIKELNVQNEDNLARIAETHILCGLDEMDCQEIGISEGNYMPQTLEEKIVCYADKLTKGANYVPMKERFNIWFEKYGHTRILEKSYERAKKLEEEIRVLML